jgi:peroxiredoxin
MAAQSQMLELETSLPDFTLPDVVSRRQESSRAWIEAPAIVVAFICNHCPYVKHMVAELAEFGRYCAAKGVKMVAISSNNVETHPEDAPPAMAELAQAAEFSFPYLYDEDQSVAKLFRAACTPEFYVFDRSGKLAYRGQFDDSRPGNGRPVTGRDLRAAVDSLLEGKRPDARQVPSIGCSIKWKAGNAPEYG